MKTYHAIILARTDTALLIKVDPDLSEWWVPSDMCTLGGRTSPRSPWRAIDINETFAKNEGMPGILQ